MLDVGLLALEPRLLRRRPGIGAVLDDAGDGVAEAAADVLEPRPPALVLRRVVQQRGDGLVLGAAVVEDDGGDREEVGQIGGAGSLAQLFGMRLVGVADGVVEAGGECSHLGCARRQV